MTKARCVSRKDCVDRVFFVMMRYICVFPGFKTKDRCVSRLVRLIKLSCNEGINLRFPRFVWPRIGACPVNFVNRIFLEIRNRSAYSKVSLPKERFVSCWTLFVLSKVWLPGTGASACFRFLCVFSLISVCVFQGLSTKDRCVSR